MSTKRCVPYARMSADVCGCQKPNPKNAPKNFQTRWNRSKSGQ